MKQIRSIILALAVILITSACHTELNDRIATLKLDVKELENSLMTLRSNVNALSEIASALESNDNIVDVDQMIKNGKKGYTISFSSGAKIDLYQGVNGITPIVGIRMAEDGEYYWTIQMGEKGTVQWMTSGLGVKCRATSTNIKLKIEDGWWWWSLDEKNWTAYCKSIGDDGKTVFANIDNSNRYFVTIKLANNQTFTVIRKEALELMELFLQSSNEEFVSYNNLVNQFDTTLFIKQVVECVDDSANVIGYKFIMQGDSTEERAISITNGVDITQKISIKFSEEDEFGNCYWMYKIGDEEYQYIMVDSTKLQANAESGYPVVGMKDTLDSYCLTIKLSLTGVEELLLNAAGEPVKLLNNYSFDWFSNVDIEDDIITFTLKDGTDIVVPRQSSQPLPVMTFKVADTLVYEQSTMAWKYVEPDSCYTIQVDISNYKEKMKLSAVVLDASGYVQSITGTGASKEITFRTAADLTPFVSVAVFLSWDDKTVMKVAKFESKEKTVVEEEEEEEEEQEEQEEEQEE